MPCNKSHWAQGHLLLAICYEVNVHWVKSSLPPTIQGTQKKTLQCCVYLWSHSETEDIEAQGGLLRAGTRSELHNSGVEVGWKPDFLPENPGMFLPSQLPWLWAAGGPATILCLLLGTGIGNWWDHLPAGMALSTPSSGPSAASRWTHSCNLNEQCAKPLKTELGLSFYCRREEMRSWGAHV